MIEKERFIMSLKPEKIRLVANIACFAIACVCVISLMVFCIFISIEQGNGNDKESQESTRAVSGDASSADELNSAGDSLGTDKSKVMNGDLSAVSKKYYLVEEKGKICIYEVREGENVFYDYAAVEKSLMSEELSQQLKKGISVDSEAELYEFLQTYSS